MKRMMPFWLCVLGVVPWVLYALLGSSLASWIDTHYQSQVLSATRGRVLDVPEFIRLRCVDVCLLWSTACAGFVCCALAFPWIQRRIGSFWACLPQTALAFVLLNGWILVAEQTNLFWMTLYVGGQDLRMPSIQMEIATMREAKRPYKVAVLGSSQCHAQIDVGLLNQLFQPDFFFANLTFVGSEPLDMLAVQHHLGEKPEYLVCYLSELGFFHGLSSDQRLFSLQTDQIMADITELDSEGLISASRRRQALLARWIPLFRLRESLEGGFFGQVGPPVVPQHRKLPMSARAEKFGKELSESAATRLHTRALRRLVENARENGTEVVLIAGSINPLVDPWIKPDLRRKMLEFLAELDQLPHVTLVADLPRPSPEQYVDLTHINTEFRPDYTRKFADAFRARVLPALQSIERPGEHFVFGRKQ